MTYRKRKRMDSFIEQAIVSFCYYFSLYAHKTNANVLRHLHRNIYIDET